MEGADDAGFGQHTGDLWLVSHRDPDFDAFCAMYLVRSLLEKRVPSDGWGEYLLHPDGWFQGARDKKIDWFDPNVKDLPSDRRWPAPLEAKRPAGGGPFQGGRRDVSLFAGARQGLRYP